MSKAIVRTEDLVKSYRSGAVATQALRGVSIEIPRGSFCTIVGPSGHGKSTLMHLIGGLDRPTSGRVHLDGVDISQMKNGELAALRARSTGFVFQFFNLLRNLTAEENVEAAMMFSKTSGSTPPKGRARELLSLVGLEDKLNARPFELSGGQQQRVAIARALANDPDLLLMDEPTGNLDSAAEAEILGIVRDLHARGKTIVVVTHNAEIARQAQQTITIRDGQVSP